MLLVSGIEIIGCMRNRKEEQAHQNNLYATGKIELNEWRKKTDELSDIDKWNAKGMIMPKPDLGEGSVSSNG